MLITEEIKTKLQVEPEYLIQLLPNIQSKEDFAEFIPYFKNDRSLALRLLKALLKQDQVLTFCAQHKENLLSNMITIVLMDASVNPSIEIKEIILQLHAKFPQPINTAIETARKKHNEECMRDYYYGREKLLPGVPQIIENFSWEVQHKELMILTNPLRDKEYVLSSQQKDIATMVLFLHNFEKVQIALKRIEAALSQRLGAATYDRQQHRKFLTNYFKEWGEANGFKGWAKLPGFVEPPDFNSLLKDQMLFKDKIFRGLDHGEFSHIIQIMCVVEYNKEAKKRGEMFLANDPAEMIKWIGEEGNKAEPPPTPIDEPFVRKIQTKKTSPKKSFEDALYLSSDEEDFKPAPITETLTPPAPPKSPSSSPETISTKDMWTLVFDRGSGCLYEFTRPDTINRFLSKDVEAKINFPLLHTLMVEREQRSLKPKDFSELRERNPRITHFRKDK